MERLANVKQEIGEFATAQVTERIANVKQEVGRPQSWFPKGMGPLPAMEGI